ncbi:MAG: ATP-binding protein [Nitrospirota bacterium]
MKIVDPVCGMALEEKDVFGTSLYQGRTYYFCSEKCKKNFDKDPEAILRMKRSREKFMEAQRLETFGKMIDEVAHEVRNPLTSIGGFVRRVYEGLPEEDPNKRYLHMVIEDVKRLERMIKQLVELKSLSPLHTEPTDINKMITEILKSFEKDLKKNRIEIKADLAGDLPTVFIDTEKMTVAFANLIKNAIEAMQKPPKVLTISNRIAKKHIEVRISDTGKGIPQDKIKQIFDPFFTSKLYGPGLGLTFAQRIIKQHRGTISVKSKIGKGSHFTVRLPLRK